MYNNADFVIEDGELIEYKGIGGEVVIPNGVTRIANCAFANCGNLTSVEIPESIVEIGYEAFRDCSCLSKISILGNVEIAPNAFKGCSGLADDAGFTIVQNVVYKYSSDKKEVVIPNGVTAIEDGAFSGCKELASIEFTEDVTRIGKNAFSACSNLAYVKIPHSVTEIGPSAFAGCISLKSIDILANIKKIEFNMFLNCNSLTCVKIPVTVKEIDSNAFYGCCDLKNVEIPEGVTKIAERAFSGCTGLTSIKLPKGVTEIDYATFERCSALKRIEIPEGVIRIGSIAFESCSALDCIEIPGSVVEIGGGVFSGCSSLRELHIKASFKNMQKNFEELCEYCRIYTDDLTILPSSLRKYAVAGFAENIQKISETGKANYLKYIKSNASKLVDIAIKNPKLLHLMCEEKYIGAKDSSRYMEEAQKSGDSEVIALMLDYVGTKISTKEKVKAETKKEKDDETILSRKMARANQEGIRGLVFAISGKMEIFKNREELKLFIEEDGGIFTSSISAKVDYLIMNTNSMDSEKRLKAEKLGIEVITENEFIKKANHELIVPDGVIQLNDEYAYSNQHTRIAFPQSLITIGEYAFECCENIVNVEVPEGVKEIGEYAFLECSSLENVVLPQSLVKIGKDAFYECGALTIHVSEGSYAEKYCIENNIPYLVK